MDLAIIAEWDRRFRIPGAARVVAGAGGLAKVSVTSPTAVGEMYLHGAHVTSWRPRGADEVLFVSAQSRWEDGRAIRGGVPVCFPWFADKADDPKAPAHGFVRTKAWQLESIVEANNRAVTVTRDRERCVLHRLPESIVEANGVVTVSMFADSNADTKRWWPADFHLVHRVTFGAELNVELVLTNTGTSSFRFEEALHAYFRVGDINQSRLHGLDGADYLDKTDSGRKKTQHGPVAISAETDRVYLNTSGAIELEDQALRRRIHVAKHNSLTTVIWNPWVEKAKAMSDFGDDEWRQMVCIETSNVGDFAVELAPGRQHAMQAIIRLADL